MHTVNHFAKVVFSVATFLYSESSVVRPTPHNYSEMNSSSLEYGINTRDYVIFLACSAGRANMQHPLLAVLPKAWTSWSGQPRTAYQMLLQNTAMNSKTVVFIVSSPQDRVLCPAHTPRHPLFFQMTDWIMLPASQSMPRREEVLRVEQTLLTCKRSSPLVTYAKEDKLCLSLNGAIVLHRQYDNKISEDTTSLKSAFSGQHISFGCIRRRKAGVSFDYGCASRFYVDIFIILRNMNATYELSGYPSTTLATNSIFSGKTDVLITPVKQEDTGFRFLLYPRPLVFTRETFYVRNDHSRAKLSSFELLQVSYLGVTCTIFALLATLLTLGLFDYLELRRLNVEALGDSAMFLVASFLATSAPVAVDNSGRNMRFHKLGRLLIIGVWMLGILPLSVYYRSQLTSRLMVSIPPDPVDTKEELEAALDKKQILPCLVRDGCYHSVVDGHFENANRKLDTKLRSAFQANLNNTRLLHESAEECLRCASRPGFVCLLCQFEECAHVSRGTYVGSQEPLNVAIVTTPMRKNFHLARAYDRLLQRLFETSQVRLITSNPCDADTTAGAHLNEYKEEVLDIFEVSKFFGLFMTLMALSTVVFLLELLLGHCM